MLERYTGSPPERFRKQIILTNFEYYLERFHNLCGDERTRARRWRVVHSKSRGRLDRRIFRSARRLPR